MKASMPPRVVIIVACLLASPLAAEQPALNKPATPITVQTNQGILGQLAFNDRQDFDDAKRGFIAALPGEQIETGGSLNWDLKGYEFLKSSKVPDTVNPSLWRIAQLNLNNGLFKVVDRVYQVRGYDLSNLTIIEGDSGLILIDPLVTEEAARAALALYRAHVGGKPVVAVIYTHSHADHYGGVKGVVDEADVESGKVKILAPEGFMKEAVAENVYAGNAMGRRSLYQYGALLPKGPQGQLDAGLGKTTSFGKATLIAPTDSIARTGETRTVDGVQMEFQMAPNTEAPAEFLVYFPQLKLLDAAEDATHTMHNLYTLRGAQVRDAATWWKTLNEAIERYGPRTEVVIAQHHWPMWGQQRIVEFLGDQRDMFKFLHDRTLNLANKGYTINEIAEQMRLPDSLGQKWYSRGYYGSLNHNAKAVYQRYLGWYDSNPSNLWSYPPSEAGKRFVDTMGGAANVVAKAKEYLAKGDYRWAAQLANNAVFADPKNQEARNVGADALEQLGYQQENPTWRNEFLMGAFELRNGVPKVPGIETASPDVVAAMTTDMLLDYMGIRLDADKAAGRHIRLNWVQPDTHDKYAVELVNSVLIYTPTKQFREPDATLTIAKVDFTGLLMAGRKLDQEIAAGKASVQGNAARINELFGMLDTFNPMFAVVEP